MFSLRAKVPGQKWPVVQVDSLEAAETWIDQVLLKAGPDDVLMRTGLEHKKGRMTKGGPLVDIWQVSDLFCTKPFQVFIIKTADLKGAAS